MKILATGQATWDEDQATWVVTDPSNMDKLVEWLPPEYQAEARRQAAERAPLYAEQARQERERYAREAAEAQAKREYAERAVAAVEQREKLIEAAQQRIMLDTKEALKAAETKAEAAIEDLGSRPTFIGREEWDTKNAKLQKELEKAKYAYIDHIHDPYASTKAKTWAAGEVDAANPELADLAKKGSEILKHEAEETRAQSKNLGQTKSQEIDQTRGPRRK
jgi:DNA repair exonuclease SbcCD ATPase subunit